MHFASGARTFAGSVDSVVFSVTKGGKDIRMLSDFRDSDKLDSRVKFYDHSSAKLTKHVLQPM